MKGLWSIVDGTENALTEGEEHVKFLLRSNCALATIVLAVGSPKDPVEVFGRNCRIFFKRRHGPINWSSDTSCTPEL